MLIRGRAAVAGLVLWTAVGVGGTVACSSAAPDSGPAMAPGAAAAPAETTVPLLDTRAVRFKDELTAAGLTAGVPDETLLAVARGLCDQLAAGVPEDRILDTVRPVAAYAASVSGSGISGDDAARRYLVAARDGFC